APADARRPAAVAALRAGAVDQRLLGLAERVRCVADEPARVLDLRGRRRVRLRVPDRHVADAVDGQAPHEAEQRDRTLRVARLALDDVGGYGALGGVGPAPAD